MLIQSLKKPLSMVLISSLIVSNLNAKSILSNTISHATSLVGSQATNLAQNLVNQYTGSLSGFLSDLLGIKININCAIPKIEVKNFNACNWVDNFKYTIGPCAIRGDYSDNPLYKRLKSACDTVSKGTGLDSYINATFDKLSEDLGLKKADNAKKIKYHSGITFLQIYGDFEGKVEGYFVKMAKTKPNSPDAKAFLADNKEILLVKENLIKSSGTTDLSKVKLPKNLGSYKKMISDNADIYAQSVPNIVDIISSAQEKFTGNACLKYIKVDSDQRSIDYNKYLNCFNSFVKGEEVNGLNIDPDKTIPKLYQTIDSAINYKYANKLLILKATSKFYEYAPTQTKFELTPIDKKADFLYKSMVWTAQETDLLGEREIEREKAKEKVRIALKKAYIASMPFDSKAAQYELSQLLQ